MRRLFSRILFSVVCLAAIGPLAVKAIEEYKSGKVWAEPKVVTPGDATAPPSDAIVLFDGKDLSQWQGGHWKVQDGVAIVGGGDIRTKDSFGDYQLHVEWAEPEKVVGSSQGRGNSGIFLADRYEVQVLDSYDNATYWDGACGSIYKQYPPLVNACRKPGEWQTYDIIFQNPRFDADGKLKTPGYVTILQNNIVVQNHSELQGSTYFDRPAAYSAHPLKQPIHLQDHGNPVRYRNIWLRELGEREA